MGLWPAAMDRPRRRFHRLAGSGRRIGLGSQPGRRQPGDRRPGRAHLPGLQLHFSHRPAVPPAHDHGHVRVPGHRGPGPVGSRARAAMASAAGFLAGARLPTGGRLHQAVGARLGGRRAWPFCFCAGRGVRWLAAAGLALAGGRAVRTDQYRHKRLLVSQHHPRQHQCLRHRPGVDLLPPVDRAAPADRRRGRHPPAV